MNVLITLPAGLIKEISKNRKWYEIRPCFPLNYNRIHNRIFVVEKGTNQIRLSFRSPRFIKIENRSEAWRKFGNYLGVSINFYFKFTKSKKNIYLWPITNLILYDDGCLTTTEIGIRRNPQSFCYFSHSKKNSELFTNP